MRTDYLARLIDEVKGHNEDTLDYKGVTQRRIASLNKVKELIEGEVVKLEKFCEFLDNLAEADTDVVKTVERQQADDEELEDGIGKVLDKIT